jgi:hypothetical protein
MLDKNIIKRAVRNPELLRALEERERLNEVWNRLIHAVNTMKETGVDESAIDAAAEKRDEYKKIKAACENYIEDAFGVTWHYWQVILKSRGLTDAGIDRLAA